MRVSHSLTVASANIFLLVKKESKYFISYLDAYEHHVYSIYFYCSVFKVP
jgi:hypothetical protein